MGINSALGSSALLPAGLGFRNLIINGGMQVNQRNTAVSGYDEGYSVDRWISSNAFGYANVSTAQNSDVPVGQGLTKSLRLTVTAGSGLGGFDITYFSQKIEGFNSASLAYGTAGAKTVTLSFWVRSTVTGTYTVRLNNTSYARNYVVGYTISSANTWEKKTITIAGDTSGTWATDNTAGVELSFVISADTSILAGTGGTWSSDSQRQCVTGQVNGTLTTGNIFAITGVQLEANLQPTPFEQRPIGVELHLCQRYYYRFTGLTSGGYHRIPSLIGTTGAASAQGVIYNPVPLRTLNGASSIEYYQVSISDNLTFDSGYGTLGLNTSNSSTYTTFITISSIAGTVTQGLARVLELKDTAGYIGVSAEL